MGPFHYIFYTCLMPSSRSQWFSCCRKYFTMTNSIWPWRNRFYSSCLICKTRHCTRRHWKTFTEKNIMLPFSPHNKQTNLRSASDQPHRLKVPLPSPLHEVFIKNIVLIAHVSVLRVRACVHAHTHPQVYSETSYHDYWLLRTRDGGGGRGLVERLCVSLQGEWVSERVLNCIMTELHWDFIKTIQSLVFQYCGISLEGWGGSWGAEGVAI